MRLGLQLVLFTVFALAASYAGDEADATGCPKRFGGRCHCGLGSYRQWNPDRDLFITNCTNAGFTDPDVLEYVPPQSEIVIFTGNHFPTLPWNIFGIWNDFKQLEVIDLTNNGINEIQGKSFHKVGNVKRLILNHNDLYIVSAMHHPRVFSNFENLEELHLTNAFTEQIDSKWYLTSLKDIFVSSNLTKLKKLHLEQNEIWEISSDDLFCDLPSLMDLHLGDNQLTDINFSLSCLRQLRYLDLEYNKITNIPKKTLDLLEDVFGNHSSTSQIDLHGNPYTCDCHMMPFFDWLKTTRARLVNKDEMRCYDGLPASNAGKRIKNLRDLACPAVRTLDTSEHNSGYAVASTLLILLIVLITSLILLVLWVNRLKVREKLSPLVKNFRNSMQYSTIGKEEEHLPPEVNV